jgi:hypothetical protein
MEEFLSHLRRLAGDLEGHARASHASDVGLERDLGHHSRGRDDHRW